MDRAQDLEDEPQEIGLEMFGCLDGYFGVPNFMRLTINRRINLTEYTITCSSLDRNLDTPGSPSASATPNAILSEFSLNIVEGGSKR